MGRGNPAPVHPYSWILPRVLAHRFAILTVVTLVSLLAGGCGNEAAAQLTSSSTISSVQQGNHVMYGRPSKTDPYYWVFAVRRTDGAADTFTYRWDVGDGLVHQGPTVTYRYTQNGTKTVTVHGMNGSSVALTMTLQITVAGPNRAPVADAGGSVFVDEGTVARLDASSSTDADGDKLSFEWRQTSGPSVELDDAASPSPSFVAPSVTTHTMLIFAVRVSDGKAAAEDTVGLVVRNIFVADGPVASAGPDQQVTEGALVELDGTASLGSGITYAWTQTAGPLLAIEGADTAQPAFEAPNVMKGSTVEFVFQLIVASAAASSADTVRISVTSDGLTDPIAACNIDWDADRIVNCDDGCPLDNKKAQAGACGCGISETDADRDGKPDCMDLCPLDAAKVESGVCGCGVSEDDPTCAACATSTPAWANRAFPAQTGQFLVNFSVTPEQSAVDGIVGLSDGAGSTFTAFAAGVRFSPSGIIDVRNGSTYSAQQPMPYSAGTTYNFRLYVDLPGKKFNVYVRAEGGSEQTLATNYAFRTETVGATALNNWGLWSGTGAITACDFAVAGLPLSALAGADVTVAPGAPVVLSGVAIGGVPPYQYLWTPSIGLNSATVAQPTATVPVTTTYTLRVTDSLNATALDAVRITVQTNPLAANAGSDVSLPAGSSWTLAGSASGGVAPYTYQWSPSTGLSSATSAQPVASPAQTTTYTLTVKDAQNQTATDTVAVTVGAAGKIYYVNAAATNAADTNPGTESQPWKTLTKAGAAGVAGDTIMVKAGTYTDTLRVQNNGSAGAMITFRASPACVPNSDPYQPPTCGVKLTNGAGIDINRKSYVRVEGFEITNRNDAGVWCQTRSELLSHHVEIVNNYIHDLNGYGIECRNARDTLIENNYIRNIHSSAGIGFRGDQMERNVTIRGNKVLHVDCDGIHIEGENILIENNILGDSYHTDCHQDALEVYGPVDGLTIRNNLIWDWTQNIYLSAETNYLRNVNVLGNVVWCDRYCAAGNDAPGVNAGPNVADLTNLRIEGNTFYNVWNLITDGYARSSSYWITGLKVHNNVFCKSRLSVEINGSFESDFNLFHETRLRSHSTLAGYRAAYPGMETNSMEADPKFVNAGSFDFRLRTDSPAIDRGKIISDLMTDPDGRARNQGAGFDLGAYEIR